MWTRGQALQQVQTQARPCLQWPQALRAVSACSGLQHPSPRSPLSCMQTRGSRAGGAEGRRCPREPASKRLHHLPLSFLLLASWSWGPGLSAQWPRPLLGSGWVLRWAGGAQLDQRALGPTEIRERTLVPQARAPLHPHHSGSNQATVRRSVLPGTLTWPTHRVSSQPSLLQEPPTAHACPSHGHSDSLLKWHRRENMIQSKMADNRELHGNFSV